MAASASSEKAFLEIEGGERLPCLFNPGGACEKIAAPPVFRSDASLSRTLWVDAVTTPTLFAWFPA